MALTKVLISVKTYPTLSERYDELVCTAGFLEDGSWIRIYPIPFRKLKMDSKYQKWQWIEIDLTKNTKDFRKESYRPTNIDNEIKVLDKVGTEGKWMYRKSLVLRNVHYNMDELIAEAKNPQIGTSLAVFKPKEVLDFVWEECEREWDSRKLEAVYANQAQQSLFSDIEETKRIFRIAKKLPYEFSYKFTSEDGKVRKLMIEDWELGMLYWNCLESSNGDEQLACQKVKQKYFDEMCHKKDIHFFLGTTKKFHNVGPNPFIIIGTFYPPLDSQLSLIF
ncbi:MAG: hypothetical protein IJE15_00555 [Bacteroidaceae bacterium]|nr:hypothetical protein [Bacteroidaceae bacterium]